MAQLEINNRNWPSYLAHRLSGTLPGWEAHRIFASRTRYRSGLTTSDAQNASVLILVYPYGSGLRTVLIRRSNEYDRDKHRGQVSFPGGKMDEKDRDAYETATREANEEIGIIPGQLITIGRLSNLYIPVSNFLVSPFVSWIEKRPDFEIDKGEVEEIIEVELMEGDFLSTKKWTDIKLREDFVLREIPYFDIKGNIVWGATAMILSEFFTMTGLSVQLSEMNTE